jgi:hypothetical protein
MMGEVYIPSPKETLGKIERIYKCVKAIMI